MRFFGLLLGLLLLIACGGPRQLEVRDAWLLPSSAGGTGGAYLTIANGPTADLLLRIESPVAEAVELHQTTMDGAIMSMRPVSELELPANRETVLGPGNFHIMLMSLKQNLTPGSTVPLTLYFQQAAPITVQAIVRAP